MAPVWVALLLLALGRPAAVAGQAEADAVEALPLFLGTGNEFANLSMYSGFLTASENPKRELFYAFFESEGNPAQDPLVLWLGSGPGCSAFGVGAFRGPGPFAFEPYDLQRPRNVTEDDLSLGRNQGSWTAIASMLFLDSPVRTGFSRGAAAPADDATTTADNLAALKAFYQKFPGYAQRPLFLAGQGYAGHYVPLLAAEILKSNAALPAGGQGAINLQGVILGNPWVDPAIDNAAAIEEWYSGGFISAATYAGLKANCDLKATALWRTEGASGVSGECERFRNDALREAYPIDLYGTNAPKCRLMPPVNVTALGPAGWLPLEGDIYAAGPQPTPRQPNLRNRAGGVPQPMFDACAAWRVNQYLNIPEVQEALHVIQPGAAALEWLTCDGAIVEYSQQSLVASMVPAFQQLANSTVRVLVYSGDTDAVMPTRGTRQWVEGLGLPQDGPFRAWSGKNGNGEASGFLQRYKGLTLATVHDAGHSAPYFKPAKVRELAGAFMSNKMQQL